MLDMSSTSTADPTRTAVLVRHVSSPMNGYPGCDTFHLFLSLLLESKLDPLPTLYQIHTLLPPPAPPLRSYAEEST